MEPFPDWMKDSVPEVDTPFTGLEGRLLTVDGETGTYEPGDTYEIPSGAEHSARFEAGSSVIDVFQDPDRYSPK